MAKIKVWLKEPRKSVRHVWISSSLENLQKTVGGYIENFALSPDVGIICNEEGKIRQLPYNCKIEEEKFHGTIIFVGYAGEDIVSCPWEIGRIREYYPQLFIKEE